MDGDLAVCDPVLTKEGDSCYVFCAGGFRGQGIVPIRKSPDMLHWELDGFVFDRLPEWVGYRKSNVGSI